MRSALGYPPFGRLAIVTVSGPSPEAVQDGALELRDALVAAVPETWRVLGPVEPAIARLRGAYRRRIVIKAPPASPVGPLLTRVLSQVRRREGVSMAPDVDPLAFV